MVRYLLEWTLLVTLGYVRQPILDHFSNISVSGRASITLAFSLAGKQQCNIPLQIMQHTTMILTKVNEGISVITVLLMYILVLLGCDAISLHR